MRSRPEVGLVRSRWDMYNQHGDKVLQMEGYGMFRRRHPASAQEMAAASEADRGEGLSVDFKPLVTLLAVVNPLAIVPFFIHYTQGFTPRAAAAHGRHRRPSPPSW